MNINEIREPTLVICSNEDKKYLLKMINTLVDISFMSLKELTDKLFFTYDEQAIYYVMNKDKCKYDIANTYLKNLVYLGAYNDDKLVKLAKLKKELITNNLLIFDSNFNNYLKQKKVIIYNPQIVDKWLIKIVDHIKKITDVKIMNLDEHNYSHQVIKFNSLEEEVNYVASSIVDLINQGININNIKLTNIDDEYIKSIKRVFNLYHIPINFDNSNSIYGSIITKCFLDNYDNDLNVPIEIIKNNYQSEIVNQIITICNKYAWKTNEDVKELIIYDLKHTFIKENHFDNAVEIIDYNQIISDNYYVFMLGFNLKSYPIIKKDEDYLNDNELINLGLSPSHEINKLNKNRIIKIIKSIMHLTITYKLESYTNSYLPSNLINEMNMETITINPRYNYSHLANKINLCKYLDNYYKYGVKTPYMDMLFHNYSLNYRNYSNKYSGIKKESLYKVINNNLTLSYSSLQSYNECAFKYYISNILRLNKYEDTFYTFIGSLFHYVLERGIKDNININEEINNYITINKDKLSFTFTKENEFFLKKLSKDLILILETVRNELSYSKLKDISTEVKIIVDKSKDINITIKGFIDKMITLNNGYKTYVVLIDYKTYDASVKMDLLDYGLNIQLPIYVYLVNKQVSNPEFVGFYVQRILSSDNSYNENITLTETKKKNMKLVGYSNQDENIISMFDETYNDSKIINGLRTKNDGTFYSYSKTLSSEQINDMIKKVDNVLDNNIKDILNTKFNINPKSYNEQNISCQYCTYRDLCYKTMADEEVIEIEGDNDDQVDE